MVSQGKIGHSLKLVVVSQVSALAGREGYAYGTNYPQEGHGSHAVGRNSYQSNKGGVHIGSGSDQSGRGGAQIGG